MTKPPTRLLCLEDNPGDFRLVQAKLYDAAPGGFVITHVERLAEALECLQNEPFDVVLSDLSLPDSNRLDTVTTMVAHAPNLALVVLTGSNDDALGNLAIQQGAQDYLVKNDSSGSQIARTLRYAIERKSLDLALRRANTSLESQVAARTAELEISLNQLRASLANAHALTKSASDAIITSNQHQTILSWNLAAERIFGYTEAQAMGQKLTMIIPPRYHARHEQGMRHALAGGNACILGQTVELSGVTQAGVEFPLELSLSTWYGTDGQMFAANIRDISERKQSEEKLLLAANVFTFAREGILITDATGTIVKVNDAFSRITGYSREEAVGKNPNLLNSGRQNKAFYSALWRDLLDKGYWSGEIWNRHKNGAEYAELLTISAVRDLQGNTVHYVAQFTDITVIKQHQTQLEHIAHFDALTDLPNRTLLADRLQQAMAQVLRRGQKLVVVYLDLDGFKLINDRHGHEMGDKVLITLAARMKQALRETDTLARLGGDEFVAVLADLDDVTISLPMLNRLLAAVAQPVEVGALVLEVSASIGATFYPQAQELDADQLLRQADQAMYQAKLAGKNRYHVFDAEQDSSIRSHNESLERIRLALAHGEFVLHYQPKVNMRSGQVIGAEALIRWQHPERGLLSPVAFLPIIEDHPLSVSVGEWVIDQALCQVERWRAAGLVLPVSVNIAARQLQQPTFFSRLCAILAEHPQLHPGCIELEILETSALQDMAQVSQVIEDCAQIGVNFSLDDFGTGYSSLTYLKRLRVTMIKIDQSFVRDMLDDPDDMAILQGVIGLAASFKRLVIAEGVETVGHGTLLLQLGCDLAQGYGIARPMPGDNLPAWASSWRPEPDWFDMPFLDSRSAHFSDD